MHAVAKESGGVVATSIVPASGSSRCRGLAVASFGPRRVARARQEAVVGIVEAGQFFGEACLKGQSRRLTGRNTAHMHGRSGAR
jgi:hypothetical protein